MDNHPFFRLVDLYLAGRTPAEAAATMAGEYTLAEVQILFRDFAIDDAEAKLAEAALIAAEYRRAA